MTAKKKTVGKRKPVGKKKKPAKKKATRSARGVDFEAVRHAALALPDVEEGTSYGTPAFRVKKKLFARMREEGEDLVLRVGDDLRDVLLATESDVFHQTPHYVGHPYVLARLAVISEPRLASIVEEAWRSVASARLVATLESAD